MIYLNKDALNTVILTLTENSSLVNPYFLFEFTNDMTGHQVVFNAADLSTYKSRYNRFEITESGSTYTNLTGGTVNLTPSGFWSYNIYEASASTLNVSGSTGIVLETGKAYINGVDNSIPSIYR